jgi:exosome complex component RRP46
LQSLPIIPALIQASVLALLSAAVPLRATATSTVIAVSPESKGKDLHQIDPTPRQLEESLSCHVFAFTSQDRLLLTESEGDFSFDEWDRAYQTARRICCGSSTEDPSLDLVMGSDGLDNGTDLDNLRHFIRATAEAKVAEDLEWKNGR